MKLNYVGIAAAVGLLIGFAFWWATSEMKDRKDPLNQSDAFVYSDEGKLYWFELTSRNGKVKGKFNQRKIIEEPGKVPVLEEKQYTVTGETTQKGYELKVAKSRKMIDAWFSGGNLFVQERGKTDIQLYKAADQAKLTEFEKAIQQKLELAIYHSEEKEKNRLRNFFSELNQVYGYLYSAEDGSFQLLLKIDEALLQGELSGSLLMMETMGNTNPSYKENKYALNGITDGLMVQFFTTVDGKKTKLKGNFHGSATDFDLSFWTTDQKLSFHAVSEAEFKQSYEKFKTKAQNKQ